MNVIDAQLAAAADLMKVQAGAIEAAADRLDVGALGRAIELLVGVTGKVVLLGAGTSGIVSRKIAATLTSTGTKAVFLHPSDALHGALGIVDRGDAAIVLSNSGETDEILAILPYLENRKVPVIAIVGNLESTLAQHAQVVLDAFAAREACPLNLAPTASTSVALALGDVLAMTLMQVKELTPEDFARNHPSGRLGKRLTLTVGDLMTGGDHQPVIAPSESWLAVVSVISEGGVGAAIVEDEAGRLLGIITDGDVRRAVQATPPPELGELRADEFMTRDPVTVTPDLLAYDALQLMENRSSQIGVLPVVDVDERCVGVIRLHDLVRSGI